MADRQYVQELRKHLVVLHNVQNQGTGPSMCAACAAIQSLIQDKPEAKQCALPRYPSNHDAPFSCCWDLLA